MPDPLPPIIERSLRAQALLPSHRRTLDFFRQALLRFQTSGAILQTLCSVHPRRAPSTVHNVPLHLSAATATPPRLSIPPRTLVVLDSSFNPPTVAHLSMAATAVREVVREYRTDHEHGRGRGDAARLLLLLAVNNADKAPKPAAFEQRLAMMHAFAKDVRAVLAAEEHGEQDVRQGENADDPDLVAQREDADKERMGEDSNGISIDIAVTTKPYFHEKSQAIAECLFHSSQQREDELQAETASSEDPVGPPTLAADPEDGTYHSPPGTALRHPELELSPEEARLLHKLKEQGWEWKQIAEYFPSIPISTLQEIYYTTLNSQEPSELPPDEDLPTKFGKQDLQGAQNGHSSQDVGSPLLRNQYDRKTFPVSDEKPRQLFLVGYDTLIRIFNPKYYGGPARDKPDTAQDAGNAMRVALAPFFARARLRVTMRTDDDWGGREDQIVYVENLLHGDGLEKVGGLREWAEKIELVEGNLAGNMVVSSTLAREAAKRKDWRALRELVSPKVAKWIEHEGLYEE